MRSGVRLGRRPRRRPDRRRPQRPVRVLATPVETVRRGRGDLARIAAPRRRGRARSRSSSACRARCPAARVRPRPRRASSRPRWSARIAPVPVRLFDERLTTVTAEAMLRDRGRKGRKRRAVVDQAAAVLILQHALDTERATGEPRRERSSRETGRPDDQAERRRGSSRRADPRRGRPATPQAAPQRGLGLPGGARRRWPCWSAASTSSSTRGVDVRQGPVRRRPRTTPGPGTGEVIVRGRARATASPRWAATSRPTASWPRSTRSSSRGGRTRDSTRIQVGFYQLKKEMAAADALDVLLDPDNILKNTVTIPEGLRVEDIVALLADEHRLQAGAASRRSLDDPDGAGAARLRGGQPRGLPLPVDLRLRPEGDAEEHAHGDGRPLGAGRGGRRPRGRGAERSATPRAS